MNTKKLTEAAMLSALFVVISLLAMSTGIMYTFYLDMIVPIFIGLIYLRCDFKYSVLSSITALLIILFVLGDIATGIWMIQSILLGFACAISINMERSIFDDIFWCSIFACFLMIIIDVYFSTLLGYSFMKEFQTYVKFLNGHEYLKEQLFYVLIAALPLGTVMVSYFGILMLGKKLKLLNEISLKKFILIFKFKNYVPYLCCSKKTINLGIIYLLILFILRMCNININSVYIKTVAMSCRVIVLYFILKDAFSMVCKYLYLKEKSTMIVKLCWIVIMTFLIIKFRITAIILIAAGWILDFIFKIRIAQIRFLNKNLKMNLQ